MDDAKRFSNLRQLPGVQTSTDRVGRTYTILLKLDGQIIATKVEVTLRGRITKEYYMFPSVVHAGK